MAGGGGEMNVRVTPPEMNPGSMAGRSQGDHMVVAESKNEKNDGYDRYYFGNYN